MKDRRRTKIVLRTYITITVQAQKRRKGTDCEFQHRENPDRHPLRTEVEDLMRIVGQDQKNRYEELTVNLEGLVPGSCLVVMLITERRRNGTRR